MESTTVEAAKVRARHQSRPAKREAQGCPVPPNFNWSKPTLPQTLKAQPWEGELVVLSKRKATSPVPSERKSKIAKDIKTTIAATDIGRELASPPDGHERLATAGGEVAASQIEVAGFEAPAGSTDVASQELSPSVDSIASTAATPSPSTISGSEESDDEDNVAWFNAFLRVTNIETKIYLNDWFIKLCNTEMIRDDTVVGQ